MSATPPPLARQLEAWRPRAILAVGAKAQALLSEFADATPGCVLDAMGAADACDRLLSMEAARHYDFALVAGYLESVEPEQGAAVIARLRDVLAKRLCVAVAEGAPPSWSGDALSAYGFTFLARMEGRENGARLYGYDVATYKQTPEWLNPRHWAHPELWGKFRW